MTKYVWARRPKHANFEIARHNEASATYDFFETTVSYLAVDIEALPVYPVERDSAPVGVVQPDNTVRLALRFHHRDGGLHLRLGPILVGLVRSSVADLPTPVNPAFRLFYVFVSALDAHIDNIQHPSMEAAASALLVHVTPLLARGCGDPEFGSLTQAPAYPEQEILP